MALASFLLVLSCVLKFTLDCNSEIVEAYYNKIPASGVPHLDCLLHETVLGNIISIERACSVLCTKTPDCRFFCFNRASGECALHWLYVGTNLESGAGLVKTYDACYSSWSSELNIISSSMTLYAPGVYLGREPSRAIDGYYCSNAITTSTYLSTQNEDDFAYFGINLDAVYEISEIRIVGRLDLFTPALEIRVGNSPTPSLNAVVASRTYPTPLTRHDAIVLSSPASGQYLFVISTVEGTKIEIGDIQILRAS